MKISKLKIENSFMNLWGQLTTGITLYTPMCQGQGSSEPEEWQETTSGSLLPSNPDPQSGIQVKLIHIELCFDENFAIIIEPPD